MSKIKNDHRKAKRFKIEYDDEVGYDVEDEFSGSDQRKVKHGKGWWYDRRRSFWQMHSNPMKRFIASHAGQPWNDVYRKLKNRIKPNNDNFRHIAIDSIERTVEMDVQMIDGVPYKKRSAGGYWKIESDGHRNTCYVNPDTVILEIAPRRKKNKYVEPDIYKKINDKLEFWKGVNGWCDFECKMVRKQMDTWFKHEKVIVMKEKYGYWEHKNKFVEISEWYDSRLDEPLGKYHKVPVEDTKISTASKKDIRDYNLNGE